MSPDVNKIPDLLEEMATSLWGKGSETQAAKTVMALADALRRESPCWFVGFSGGKELVTLGDKVTLNDIGWEIVAPDGFIYSPSSLGGEMSFRCRPLSYLPRHLRDCVEDDGTVVFCGDTIAAALSRQRLKSNRRPSAYPADQGARGGAS